VPGERYPGPPLHDETIGFCGSRESGGLMLKGMQWHLGKTYAKPVDAIEGAVELG
jgi:hypothetical protein